jgi:polar amino acid transport system substrate-binding protein
MEELMRLLYRIVQAVVLCQSGLAFGETLTCVSYHSPPLIENSVSGISGLAVDVVRKVFQQMGYTLETKVLPLARALESVRTGTADCAFTLPNAKEYAAFLDFSMESIVPQVVYFYARKDSSAIFNGDFESIRGQRIGTAFKIHYGPRFEAARPRLTVDEALTLEQAFLKLAAGRVDLVPTDSHIATAIMASPSLRKYADRIVKLPTPSESVPTYVAFSRVRNLTSLRDAFDNALRGFIASQEYRILLSRYGMNVRPVQVTSVPG